MKTKNNLTTGILIGLGAIVLPLILMSTTYTTEKQNKYEFHTHGSTAFGWILNTETGDVWRVSTIGKKKVSLPIKEKD